MRLIFWGSAGALAHAYVVFPLLVAIRAALWPRPPRRAAITPRVSFIAAAHNEARLVKAKVDNTLALDYPPEQLEIIVVSDGSDDGTDEILAAERRPGLTVLPVPRGGKNRALNIAVDAAAGDVLVFSDVDANLRPDALRHLVQPLADDSVGVVAARFVLSSRRRHPARRAMRWFRNAFLALETRSGSITSAEGRLLAVRRELYRPLPDGVNDDFTITLSALLAGHRAVFEPGAEVYSVASIASSARFARRVRLTRRWLMTIWLGRAALDPRRTGFYAIQLMSHKIMRRFAFLPITLLGLSGLALWRRGRPYRWAGLSLLGLHGAAVIGWRTAGNRADWLLPFRSAFAFDVANIALLRALIGLLRGSAEPAWGTARTYESVAPDRRAGNGRGRTRGTRAATGPDRQMIAEAAPRRRKRPVR